ncbi:MAG: hypothetical protein ABFS10_01145 [Bacteroidota bacterium]
MKIKLKVLLKFFLTYITLIIFGIQACSSPAVDEPIEDPVGRKNSEIIGSSHVIPRYYFGDEDCLNQGADVLLEMGSEVIKIWYYNGIETPDIMYPWNSSWPTGATSLLDGLNNTHYTELFEKPFKTFVLNVASFVNSNAYYWKDYLSEANIEQEEGEFYEFTKALLEKYAGTGKTFILQHHEGDWHLRGHTNPDIDPAPEAIARMTEWLNARQRGVTKAREEVAAQDVFVYHAAEINLVVKSLSGAPNMVNKVLPYTNLDLVSYSCYDACLKAAENENTVLLNQAINFIKRMMPDSEAFGNDNVYLGEYGVPENHYTPEQIEAVMKNTVETGLEEKCPYIIYWQLYCNELKNTDAKPPVKLNEDMRGFWLVKPDGTKSWHYDYLKEMCSN